MKKLLGVMMVLALLATIAWTPGVMALVQPEVTVLINSKMVEFGGDKPFLTSDGEVLVPVGALSKAIGCEVNSPAQGSGQRLEITRKDPYITITFEVGKKSVSVATSSEAKEMDFDSTAQIHGESIYFTVKFVNKLLGYSVRWDPEVREFSIYTAVSGTDGTSQTLGPQTDSKQEPRANPTVSPKTIAQQWHDVPYANLSGTQKLDIYLPNEGEGPFPVIIVIHGGGFTSGSKDYVELHGIDRGYAVVSVGYRLAQEAKFPAQINDIKAAIRFLRANAVKYNLDPERFATWGSSAGGMLAALAGTSGGVKALQDDALGNADQSDRVQAVVDFCGGVNTRNPALFAEKEGTDAFEKAVRTAWAETYITPDDPPFLIVHGSGDQTIPIAHSAEFYNKLKNAIGESKVVFDIVEGAGHVWPLVGAVDPIDFLDLHLKGIGLPSEPVVIDTPTPTPQLVIVLVLGSRSIHVNGEVRITDVAPQAVNGRTLVPLRFIAETMGAEVDWIEESRSAVVILDGIRIELPIGYVNPSIGLDVPAQLLNGRTLVPLRYISEALGASVEYKEATNSVEITR